MSDYAKTLNVVDKKRYVEKLCKLGFTNMDMDDPYLPDSCGASDKNLKKLKQTERWIDNVTAWPNVEFGSIYVYLIDCPGPFTRESMHAYRSLEAYNYYVSGWVQTCLYRKNDFGNCIIKAKVARSQAVNEKPHYAWVGIRQKDGSIESGHCTCMAGLGEVCSHVAAILFKVEAASRLGYNNVACTSLPCQWNQTFVKKVEPSLLSEIDFRKPSTIRKKPRVTRVPDRPLVPNDPTEFLKNLNKVVPNAVIFTVTDPKPQPAIPCVPTFPIQFKTLFDINHRALSEDDLAVKCQEVFDQLIVTKSQAKAVELGTRCQSQCRMWYEFRECRLTASNFHDITHTSITKPSMSVIERVMQYRPSFSIPATKWGVEHENVAMDLYRKRLTPLHTNLKVGSSGFVINPLYPHLGASPDGIVECDCCGQGVVEVKCPYKHKDTHPCNVIDSDFFFKKHTSLNPVCNNYLQPKHKYMSQIQGQMGLCNVKYCDFVCWTSVGIHIERIVFDNTYFRDMEVKLMQFFKLVILPEILTRRTKIVDSVGVLDGAYCLCGKGEGYGDMIACDSHECAVEWFHMKCVDVKVAPKGAWYCNTCKSKNKKRV